MFTAWTDELLTYLPDLLSYLGGYEIFKDICSLWWGFKILFLNQDLYNCVQEVHLPIHLKSSEFFLLFFRMVNFNFLFPSPAPEIF